MVAAEYWWKKVFGKTRSLVWLKLNRHRPLHWTVKAQGEEKHQMKKTTTELIYSFHVEKIQEQFELDKRNN